MLELSGKRVLLREFTQSDIDDVLAIVGDDRVTRWLSFDIKDLAGATATVDAARVAADVHPRTEYYLAVQPFTETRLVGFVRLALSGVRAAKLGYAVQAEHWNHGYATDAASTILEFGFRQLDLHRVTAAVGPDNYASMAVLTRLGFSPEGRLRDHVFTNGAWRDSVLYSVLSHEF
jgi:ribosomal-protein-alanine N-acetyltransferase